MTPAADRGAAGASPETFRSAYLHAPFCAHRCPYCDYAIHVVGNGEGDAGGHPPLLTEWITALRGELAALERTGTARLADRLDTLYVGGGTPSVLGSDVMAAVAEVLGADRLVDPELEWSAEANPESFTEEVAEGWRRAGVNRVHLGVQSFSTDALGWLGRRHDPAEGEAAVVRARAAGYEYVGLDLLCGLPARLGRAWSDDLARALELGVDQVTVYGLTVAADTPLGRRLAAGHDSMEGARFEEEYLEADRILTDAGYRHYEVSHFALPGAESRHTARYWSGRPYLGLGNGAHSYASPVRRWNLVDWNAYRDMAVGGALPEAGREVLGAEEMRLERVWSRLRTRRGFSRDALPAKAAELVAGWVAEGLAVYEDGRVRLTGRGWLELDGLSLALDEVLTAG